MGKMFYKCKSLKYLDLSKFNTKKVTDMNNMFSGCTLLKDINVTNFIAPKKLILKICLVIVILFHMVVLFIVISLIQKIA